MARDSEKALSLFNRWTNFKNQTGAFSKSNITDHHGFSENCDSLQDAESYRRKLLQEITTKISQISQSGLGEFRIRELNDEINKMMNKKRHWEMRINDLGGKTDYRKEKSAVDVEGKELPNNRGYKYYGAAKELPGIRELFNDNKLHESDEYQRKRKSRSELLKSISIDYYGYRDDDDEALQQEESQQEKTLISMSQMEFDEMVAQQEKKAKKGNQAAIAQLLKMRGSKEEAAEFTKYLDHVKLQKKQKLLNRNSCTTDSSSLESTIVDGKEEATTLEGAKLDVSKQSLLNKYMLD